MTNKFTQETSIDNLYDSDQILEIQTEIKTRQERSFVSGYILGFTVALVICLAVTGYIALTKQDRGSMIKYETQTEVPVKVVP